MTEFILGFVLGTIGTAYALRRALRHGGKQGEAAKKVLDI